MKTYKLKKQFDGLIIQQRLLSLNNMIVTMDASKPMTSGQLANFYRYEDFRQFIDETEIIRVNTSETVGFIHGSGKGFEKHYIGVENKKKEHGKETELGTAESDSEGT